MTLTKGQIDSGMFYESKFFRSTHLQSIQQDSGRGDYQLEPCSKKDLLAIFYLDMYFAIKLWNWNKIDLKTIMLIKLLNNFHGVFVYIRPRDIEWSQVGCRIGNVFYKRV